MAKRGRPTTEQALARKALIAAVMTSATTQAATVATPTETAAEALETALETVTVAEETVLEGPLTEAATADTSDDSFVHNNWHTNENVAALTTADDLSV
jgi:CO/xanthine dehydrogenase Mo-binding subunit